MSTIIQRRNGPANPAILRCTCGAEIALTDPLTNECGCGRLFNMVGQELAPRSQWEERYEDD